MTGLHDDVGLRADMADAASEFDAAFYAAANPLVAAKVTDLLEHFCRFGWLELRKPRRDFDVWWYWANHLDPASDDINPLVHYARVGRTDGLSTRPDPTTAPGASRLPSDRRIRRACLFAGFDADGVVDDATMVYLRDLARFADVFCLYDNYLPERELAKLRTVAVGAWSVRHAAYDFGSYAMLAGTFVGWDRLATYDEVLFVNDSCYLLRPLDEVFARMDNEPCDWWGLQATKGTVQTKDAPSNQFSEPIPMAVVQDKLLGEFEEDDSYDFHIASYFLAFRGPVLHDLVFRRLIDGIVSQKSKRAIIQKYEIGLTHLLIGRGHTFATYMPDLYPLHPVYTEWAFRMVEQGFPLLKRYFLYQNHYDTPGLERWKERVRALVPDASVEVFEDNLLRTAPADRLQRSFAIERAADGSVEVPQPLSPPDFVGRDKELPNRPDWWVFIVDPSTDDLPENSRAIFDQVSGDASLTKIVLTRSRRLSLPGRNVVIEPLQSPSGQARLLEAGVVFVLDSVATALGGLRLSLTQREVVAVRGGLRFLKHGRTADVPRRPGREVPPATGALKMLHKAPKPTITAVLTASDVDHSSAIAAHWPALYADGWRTGIPTHDHLLAEILPAHLARQEAAILEQLQGRRLLLFTPVTRRSGSPFPPYPFKPIEVARLTKWADQNQIAIGLRDAVTDFERPYLAALGDAALDLSARRFGSTATVMRSADMLVTDYSGHALDFTLTGRPAISFAHDREARSDDLLYELDHLFPGPVCDNFDSLMQTLQLAADRSTGDWQRQYERVRDLMIDHRDGMNTARVVERLLTALDGRL